MEKPIKIGCQIEIATKEDGLYSVKLDGQEIGQHIIGLHFDLDAHDVPVLEIRLAVGSMSLATGAHFVIPEPYASFIRFKNKKHAQN